MKIVQSVLFSALVLSTLSLGGCMTKDLVNHTFEFDARSESPDIQILYYQYGNSKQPGANDDTRQYVGISGSMLRGDFLYVKWRIKATGEVIEDTVDLRNRLPRNIENCTIHFLVKERQLYVYLVSAKPNKNPWIKSPLRMYTHLQVDEIYPAQPKF
ncbi:MAG: hypothetical protein PHO62_05150 [Sulfurimonas sp.]|uniref:hypothetical protein n=1 Tax=Sulfurimonas sp. TaxID=2022749 RepID=UPI00261C6EFC|nr:hypothetical protein [Sulfurimonas sp.]MDD5372794.1 hypothetical protein [Sulfurimonas sp.]